MFRENSAGAFKLFLGFLFLAAVCIFIVPIFSINFDLCNSKITFIKAYPPFADFLSRGSASEVQVCTFGTLFSAYAAYVLLGFAIFSTLLYKSMWQKYIMTGVSQVSIVSKQFWLAFRLSFFWAVFVFAVALIPASSNNGVIGYAGQIKHTSQRSLPAHSDSKNYLLLMFMMCGEPMLIGFSLSSGIAILFMRFRHPAYSR